MASRRSLHSAPRPAAITHCYPTPSHFPCPQVVLEDLVCPHTAMLLQSMSFIQYIPHYITHLPFRFIHSLPVHAGCRLRIFPVIKLNITSAIRHHAPVASLIRSSFRLAGHFHKQLISSPALSVLHFVRQSFFRSMHFAAARQHILSIPLVAGWHPPAPKFTAAFPPLPTALAKHTVSVKSAVHTPQRYATRSLLHSQYKLPKPPRAIDK